MDYCVWSSLAKKGQNEVKIRDADHLCDRLGEAWNQLSQEEIDRVIIAFGKRLEACVQANGKRYEDKLKKKK